MDANCTKTFTDTKVNLELSEAAVKAGEEVTLMFDLQDAARDRFLFSNPDAEIIKTISFLIPTYLLA